MKQLLTTIAAVLLVGSGKSAQPEPIHNASQDGDIEGVQEQFDANADVNAVRIREDQAASDEFYKPGLVQKILLTISAPDMERMRRALPERRYVPATLRWRDILMENVAVRYKGNSSSSPRQRHKRSYLIKVNEYKKDSRFFGLRRIALDNGVQFGSLFSEPIITGILRDLDVPASRCNYAKLYINDRYQGVFVNVERIDESFIESRFEPPIGPLFKVDEGGPGCNLAYLGNDTGIYRKAFESKTNPAEQAYDDLIRFIQALAKKNPATYPETLGDILAFNEFLKTMAVMLFAGAFDQLTGWNPHNYYLYQDSNAGRWHYIPWDLDVGFADHAFGRIPVIEGWNAAWPIPGGPPKPFLENIVSNPKLLEKYREVASQILETYFKPNQLHQKVDDLYALIKKDLASEPHPPRRVTNPKDTGYDDIVSSIKDFISKRYQLARHQLDQPGPRPKPPTSKPQHREPQPGSLAGAPSELRVVLRNEDSIRLKWKDNATGEAGHIVQRAAGNAGGAFQNYFGLQGSAVTHTIDQKIDPSATYRYRIYAVFPTNLGPDGSKPSNVVVSSSPSKSGRVQQDHPEELKVGTKK